MPAFECLQNQSDSCTDEFRSRLSHQTAFGNSKAGVPSQQRHRHTSFPIF
jgi:hypothetical protein